MGIVNILLANYELILGAVIGILGGAYVIACIIPGEHPDKEIDAVANFLKKFSRK